MSWTCAQTLGDNSEICLDETIKKCNFEPCKMSRGPRHDGQATRVHGLREDREKKNCGNDGGSIVGASLCCADSRCSTHVIPTRSCPSTHARLVAPVVPTICFPNISTFQRTVLNLMHDTSINHGRTSNKLHVTNSKHSLTT